MERGCYLIWDCGCGNSNKYIGGISQNKDNQEIEDEVFAMKKICRYVSILFVFMMILSLAACAKEEQKGMYIKPSEFTEETREVLDLFDDEVQFFDIVLDETVKSETITVWVYRDGEWEESGKTTGPVDTLERRIAIRLTEDSYELYSMDESGHTKYTSPDLNINFDESVAILGSRVEGETKLVLNEETPILMKIGAETNSMENYNVTEDFRTMDCNAGVVITLTVSDELVE